MRSSAPDLVPIFRSQHQLELLSRLFLSQAEISMTELARELRMPISTVHREADRLAEANILITRNVGRTRLFRANMSHPLAPALRDLLAAVETMAQRPGKGRKFEHHQEVIATTAAASGGEQPLETANGMSVTRQVDDDTLQTNLPMDLSILRDVLRRHRVKRAWVFGSRARGDHRADSDLDLLYEPDGDELDPREFGKFFGDIDKNCPVSVDLARKIAPNMKTYIASDLVRVL